MTCETTEYSAVVSAVQCMSARKLCMESELESKSRLQTTDSVFLSRGPLQLDSLTVHNTITAGTLVICAKCSSDSWGIKQAG